MRMVKAGKMVDTAENECKRQNKGASGKKSLKRLPHQHALLRQAATFSHRRYFLGF
jgi:hypothetical protein